MIRVKSKSREIKENRDLLSRYTLNKRTNSKQTRLLKTAEHRNYSNQHIPLASSVGEHFINIKNRQISNHKNCRKESYKERQNEPHHRAMVSDQRQSKRQIHSKTFIGSKLRRRLQRYLLFLSLVNYSLRVSYERSEFKKYYIYVGKGNNSKLIRDLFANRFWWTITTQQSSANLVWTQKSKKKIFNTIEELEKDNLRIQMKQYEENRVKRKIKPKKRDYKKTEQEQEFECILCDKDKQAIKNQCKRQTFQDDLKSMMKRYKNQKRNAVKVTHNHIQNHRLLTNKKNLFYNLKQYCDDQNDNIFNYVPLTFHIKQGSEDEYLDLGKFQQSNQTKKQKLLWIVKPGQNSNRGCGIEICKKVEQIKKHIEKQKVKHPERTFIVQKYINPYLFHRRKFDIRCFVLITATPFISAYFYPTGYIRTSSFEFSMKNCSNKYIHLTNDAIQKKANEYSKYESGNKVSFEQFQKYLQLFNSEKNINFFNDILPSIKQLMVISVKSTKNFNSSNKEHTFEILGYDFMIDEDLVPWLIEINTNPCLETGCDILNEIIPSMVENVIKIAVDPIFKPPKIQEWALNDLLRYNEKLLSGNKFELIYSEIHG